MLDCSTAVISNKIGGDEEMTIKCGLFISKKEKSDTWLLKNPTHFIANVISKKTWSYIFKLSNESLFDK